MKKLSRLDPRIDNNNDMLLTGTFTLETFHLLLTCNFTDKSFDSQHLYAYSTLGI